MLTYEELYNPFRYNLSEITIFLADLIKPELVRLINQGFALDESIEATRKHLRELEAIKETANSGKFKLK